MSRTRLSGLYGITDSSLQPTTQDLLTAAEQALDGGMKMLQYREKRLPTAQQESQAKQLRQLCIQYDALLIVNDDVELALAVDAHGVHLGKSDGNTGLARQQLGSDRIIGTSCYNQIELAIQAQEQGADYVAFGRFFDSLTKPDAVQAMPELLTRAKKQLSIPLCAIGGIRLDNALVVVEQGADMIAVIHDLFSAQDVQQRARDFSALFSSQQVSAE